MMGLSTFRELWPKQMAEPCLLDNDVILKVATYSLNGAATSCLKFEGELPAMLGVGRFVLRQKVTKARHFKQPQRVVADLEILFEALQTIEPTEDEVELAADLEAAARQSGGAFDTGEAQLFAILLSRGSPALVTGDKRAIAAAAVLDIAEAAGRVVCLEQLLRCIAKKIPTDALRQLVCAEPQADRALSSCFACSSADSTELDSQALLAALGSYIGYLRQQSGALLMEDHDVLALAS